MDSNYKFKGIKGDIIDEYALKGYRYVGYIPTAIDANGKFNVIDLIFEKRE